MRNFIKLNGPRQENKNLLNRYHQQFPSKNKISENVDAIEVFSSDSDDISFVQSYCVPIKRLRREKNAKQNNLNESTISSFKCNNNSPNFAFRMDHNRDRLISKLRQNKFNRRNPKNVSQCSSRGARKTSYPNAQWASRNNIFSNQPIPNELAVSIDVQDLFQKLVASGLIGKSEEKPSLNIPKSLRKRNSDIINALYTGWQCGSCGIRFPVEEKIEIEKHLNLHFKECQREKIIISRSWYCSANNWVNKAVTCIKKETKHPKSSTPNCTARSNEHSKICDMCNDPFEMFFDNEADEWLFRNAIRVGETVYHPICYDDYKVNQFY